MGRSLEVLRSDAESSSRETLTGGGGVDGVWMFLGGSGVIALLCSICGLSLGVEMIEGAAGGVGGGGAGPFSFFGTYD